MAKKLILGQFNTKKNVWLKNHIREFIIDTKAIIAYDPFAGNGDLLEVARNIGFRKIKGLDIDEKLEWAKNDSLLHIPTIENSIIITNPPYLTNYSAKRKGICEKVEKYYSNSEYDDLYLIALEKMTQAQEHVVAIVPETFINSNFKQKHKLNSITIIEENCFDDTETPVCVLCFDGIIKKTEDIKVFKNDDYLDTLGHYEELRLKPSKNINILFNDATGSIALRAVDTTDPNSMIRFMKKDELDYDLKNIKESSRLITIININNINSLNHNELDLFLEECNRILISFRDRTQDVLLSPFKGNMKNGRRRRRLDYETARAMLEIAYNNIYKGDTLWTISTYSNTH
ncbi:MAG: hypothetical protein FD145_398 [Candidatus Saganbacteria bacterium]|uniref:Type II methyltransferase M.TaqI-like domain-containing protein n=1 Tax=Candidatus Saganbacteria bacterium TaxID=2575572 RepID=A0A833L4M0_UNCSA|nr:MAG: hypothetical protein FD145_398 [Candidatus Saganbacteria bacterium]